MTKMSLCFVATLVLGVAACVQGLDCHEGFNVDVGGIPFYHWKQRTCAADSSCFGQEMQVKLGVDVVMRYGACLSASYASYLDCEKLYGQTSTFDPARLLDLVPDITKRINETVHDFVKNKVEELQNLLSDGNGTGEFMNGIFKFHEKLGLNMQKAEPLKSPLTNLLTAFIGGNNTIVGQRTHELLDRIGNLDTANEDIANVIYNFYKNFGYTEMQVKTDPVIKPLVERLPGLIRSMIPTNWKASLWYDVMFELLADVNITDWKGTASDMITTIKSSYEIPNEAQQYLYPFFDAIPDLVGQMAAGNLNYAGNWSLQLLKEYSEQNKATSAFSDALINFLESSTRTSLQYEYKATIKWIPGLFRKFFPDDKTVIDEVYRKIATGFDSVNFTHITKTLEPTKLSDLVMRLVEQITGRSTNPEVKAYIINFSQTLYNLLDGYDVYVNKFFNILSDGLGSWPNINAGKVIRDLVVEMNGTVPDEIEPLLAHLQPIVTVAMHPLKPIRVPIGPVYSFITYPPFNITALFEALASAVDAYEEAYPRSPFPKFFKRYLNATKDLIDQDHVIQQIQPPNEEGSAWWDIEEEYLRYYEKLDAAYAARRIYVMKLQVDMPIDFYFSLINSFNYTTGDFIQMIIEAFPEFGSYIRLTQLLSADDIKQLIKDIEDWERESRGLAVGPRINSFAAAIKSTVEKITDSITSGLRDIRRISQPDSCKFGACTKYLCNSHGYIDSLQAVTKPTTATPSPTTISSEVRCDGCSKNAVCIDGECQCKYGFQGDGISCTGQCRGITLTATQIPSDCDVDQLSFDGTLEDLSQKSEERCNDSRSLATIQCATFGSENVVMEFDISSLKCVPCSKTLASVTQMGVAGTITAVEVEENLKILDVLTTANKTVEDVADTTKYLKNLAEALDETDPDGNPKQISEQSMKDVLEIVGNLATELDVREDENDKTDVTSSQIETKVEESSDNGKIRQTKRQINALEFQILDPKTHDGKYKGVTFEPEAYTETQSTRTNEPETVAVKKKVIKMTIPPGALEKMEQMAMESGGGPLKLVMVLYQDASLLTVDNRTGQVVQVTFKPGEVAQRTPIGATFEIEFAEPPKPTPVQETAVDDNLLELHKEYFCVFWDFIHEEWATEGCTFHKASTPYCECDHFTSFALLLRVTIRLENYQADTPSEIYSTVACALSAVCLILTVLIYLCVKELRIRRPTPILANICVNLAIAYIMFIVGMDGRARGFSDVGCYASAVIMHVVFLSSWCWMLIYSLNMYFALVKVVGTTPVVARKSFMYFVGYVVPLLIVVIDLIVSVQLDKRPKQIDATDFESNYIASHICWVRHLSMYLGFALPIGLILLVNITLFFIIIRKLTWKRKEIQSSKEAANVKQQIFMAIAMVSMMGLTWIFGYIMLISEDETFQDVMSVIFNIFNTSQGIIIFLVSCVRQKAVRDMWLKPTLGRCDCCSHQRSEAQTRDSGITASTGISTNEQRDNTAL